LGEIVQWVESAAAGQSVSDHKQRISTMPFTVTAVSPLTVTGTGTAGDYVIVQHGFHPQLGEAYHYIDKRYDFYFYLQTKDDQPPDTFSVWYISRQLFAGGTPTVDPTDANYLEQNIKDYFENVSLWSTDHVVAPIPVPTIRFDWRIRR